MEKHSWVASGKERKPGNLLKYALVVLVGVTFAAIALVVLMLPGGNLGGALLWGLIGAVGAAVIGVIIWFIYMRLLVKQ